MGGTQYSLKWMRYDESTGDWTEPQLLTQDASGYAALSAFPGRGELWCLYPTEDEWYLNWTRYDSDNDEWSYPDRDPTRQLRSFGTSSLGNDLWCLQFPNSGSDWRLRGYRAAGNSWTPPSVFDPTGEWSPGLAECDGYLYCVHIANPGSKQPYQVQWTRFDGKSWEPNKDISGAEAGQSPVLAECLGQLHCVYSPTSYTSLQWSRFSEGAWSTPEEIPATAGATGDTVPAVAATGSGKLICCYQDAYTRQLYWTSYKQESNWEQPKQFEGVSNVESGPSLACYNEDVYCVYPVSG
ncbi:hypothetical protein FHR84_002138 [Actinopolyspora biskrensis]|uniref:Uncharacterized protein n=1 Tax=Actinopolyspora biskrensis TaxID=1470178 RepID=A0A852Z9P3_9ACTN|nr:hypothetical protein [Actinopolyspora biskrensis]NYH78813.1 hypothetical protein [Actinopolyspora biskrensis]